MIFTAHQPNFLPYPGFWLKMDGADRFGLMPKAQFSKGGHINRVQIGYDETKSWLTVPIVRKFGQKIDRVQVSDPRKIEGLRKSVEHTYSKKKYWSLYGPKILGSLVPGENLADLNLKLIRTLKEVLGIETVTVEMPENSGDPSKDLLDWTLEQGCDTYISGSAGRNYLNTQIFEEAGVSVYYQGCEIAEGYKTVSILSILMDFGPDWRTQCRQTLLED
jgi:hypothetical protein